MWISDVSREVAMSVQGSDEHSFQSGCFSSGKQVSGKIIMQMWDGPEHSQTLHVHMNLSASMQDWADEKRPARKANHKRYTYRLS